MFKILPGLFLIFVIFLGLINPSWLVFALIGIITGFVLRSYNQYKNNLFQIFKYIFCVAISIIAGSAITSLIILSVILLAYLCLNLIDYFVGSFIGEWFYFGAAILFVLFLIYIYYLLFHFIISLQIGKAFKILIISSSIISLMLIPGMMRLLLIQSSPNFSTVYSMTHEVAIAYHRNIDYLEDRYTWKIKDRFQFEDEKYVEKLILAEMIQSKFNDIKPIPNIDNFDEIQAIKYAMSQCGWKIASKQVKVILWIRNRSIGLGQWILGIICAIFSDEIKTFLIPFAKIVFGYLRLPIFKSGERRDA